MNTQVILRENVEGLGTIGDIVNVKSGYARNYLVPQGLAAKADARNVKELEHQKHQLARKLEKVTCQFTQRASEEGKLFGSVTSMDLAGKLEEAGIAIDRKKIQLPDPIKSLGEHQVEV